MPTSTRIAHTLLVAVGIALLAPIARAATKTWDRGAATNNWGDANNWNPNGVPANTDDVVFDHSALGGAYTVSVNAVNRTANSVTIDPRAGAFGAGNITLQIDMNLTVATLLTINPDAGLTAKIENTVDNRILEVIQGIRIATGYPAAGGTVEIGMSSALNDLLYDLTGAGGSATLDIGRAVNVTWLMHGQAPGEASSTTNARFAWIQMGENSTLKLDCENLAGVTRHNVFLVAGDAGAPNRALVVGPGASLQVNGNGDDDVYASIATANSTVTFGDTDGITETATVAGTGVFEVTATSTFQRNGTGVDNAAISVDRFSLAMGSNAETLTIANHVSVQFSGAEFEYDSGNLSCGTSVVNTGQITISGVSPTQIFLQLPSNPALPQSQDFTVNGLGLLTISSPLRVEGVSAAAGGRLVGNDQSILTLSGGVTVQGTTVATPGELELNDSATAVIAGTLTVDSNTGQGGVVDLRDSSLLSVNGSVVANVAATPGHQGGAIEIHTSSRLTITGNLTAAGASFASTGGKVTVDSTNGSGALSVGGSTALTCGNSCGGQIIVQTDSIVDFQGDVQINDNGGFPPDAELQVADVTAPGPTIRFFGHVTVNGKFNEVVGAVSTVALAKPDFQIFQGTSSAIAFSSLRIDSSVSRTVDFPVQDPTIAINDAFLSTGVGSLTVTASAGARTFSALGSIAFDNAVQFMANTTFELASAGAQGIAGSSPTAPIFMNLTAGGSGTKSTSFTSTTIFGTFSVVSGSTWQIPGGHTFNLARVGAGFPVETHTVSGTLDIVSGDGVTPTTIGFGNFQQLVVGGGPSPAIQVTPNGAFGFGTNRYVHFTRLGVAGGYSVHIQDLAAVDLQYVQFDYLIARSALSNEDTEMAGSIQSALTISCAASTITRFANIRFDNAVDGGAPGNARFPRYLYFLSDDGDDLNGLGGSGDLLFGCRFDDSAGLFNQANVEKRALGDTIQFLAASGALAGDGLDMDGDRGAGDTGVDDILWGTGFTWDGSTDGDGDNRNWTDPLNWSADAGFPSQTNEAAFIDNAAAQASGTISLGRSLAIASLFLAPDVTLDLGGSTLAVHEDVTVTDLGNGSAAITGSGWLLTGGEANSAMEVADTTNDALLVDRWRIDSSGSGTTIQLAAGVHVRVMKALHWVNSGTFTLANGAQLDVPGLVIPSGHTLSMMGSATLGLSGVLRNEGFLMSIGGGTDKIQVLSYAERVSVLQASASPFGLPSIDLPTSGTTLRTEVDLMVSGNLTVAAGAAFEAEARKATFSLANTLTANGLCQFHDLTLVGTTTLAAGTAFRVTGSLTMPGGMLTCSGGAANVITIDGGSFDNDAPGDFSCGTSRVVFSGQNPKLPLGNLTTFFDVEIAATGTAQARAATYFVQRKWIASTGAYDAFSVGAAQEVRFNSVNCVYEGPGATRFRTLTVNIGTLTLDATDDVSAVTLTVNAGRTLRLLQNAVVRVSDTLSVQGNLSMTGSPRITDTGSGYAFTVAGGAGHSINLDAGIVENTDSNGLRVQAEPIAGLDVDNVQFRRTNGIASGTHLDLAYSVGAAHQFDGLTFDANCQFSVATLGGSVPGAVSLVGATGAKGSEAFENDGGAGVVPGGSITWGTNTRTWDNDSADGLWGTAANWSGNVLPGGQDLVVIPDVTTLFNPAGPTLNVPASVGSLTVQRQGTFTTDAIAHAFTVNGSLVVESGGNIQTQTAAHTIVVNGSFTVEVAASATIRLAGGGSWRVVGNLENAGGFTHQTATGTGGVDGDLVSSGSFSSSAVTALDANGDVENRRGGSFGAVAIAIAGSFTNEPGATFSPPGGSTVTFDGSAGTIAAGGATFVNLFIQGGCTYTALDAIAVTGTLDVDGRLRVLDRLGTIAGTDPTAGTIDYAGTARQPVATIAYFDLTISNTSPEGVYVDGSADLTWAGTLQIASWARLSAGRGQVLRATGGATSWDNRGTFDGTGSRVEVGALAALGIGGTELTTFHDVLIPANGSITVGTIAGFQVAGTWTNNHAADGFAESGTTVGFTGRPSVLAGSLATTFDNVVITGTLEFSGIAQMKVRNRFENSGVFRPASPSIVTFVNLGSDRGEIDGSSATVFYALEIDDASDAGLELDGTDDVTVGQAFTVSPGNTLRILDRAVLRLSTGLVVEGNLGVQGEKPTITDTGNDFAFTVRNGGAIRIDGLVLQNPNDDGLRIESTASATQDLDRVDFRSDDGAPTGSYLRIERMGMAAGAYEFTGCTFDENCQFNVTSTDPGSANQAVSLPGWSGVKGGESYDSDPGDPSPSIVEWPEKVWDGSAGTSWSNAANWTPAGVPVSLDRVRIDPSDPAFVGPLMPIYDAGAADERIAALTIAPGGTLTAPMATIRTLMIQGDLVVQAESGGQPAGQLLWYANPRTATLPAIEVDGTFANDGDVFFESAASLRVVLHGELRNAGQFVNRNTATGSYASFAATVDGLRIEGDLVNSGNFEPFANQFTTERLTLLGSLVNSGTMLRSAADFLDQFLLRGGTSDVPESIECGGESIPILAVADGAGYRAIDDLDVSNSITVDGLLVLEEGFEATMIQSGTGTFEFAGDEAQRVPSSTMYWNLVVSNTSEEGALLAGDVTVQADLTIEAGGRLDASSRTLTLMRDFVDDGEFEPGSSTVDFRGTPSTIRGSSLTTFHHVVIDGLADGTVRSLAIDTDTEVADHVRVRGNWDNHDTFLTGESTITFLGSPSTIDSDGFSEQTTRFHHLEIGPGAALQFGTVGAVQVDGLLTNEGPGTGFVETRGSGDLVEFCGVAAGVGGAPIAVAKVILAPGATLTLDGSDDLSIGSDFTIEAGETVRLEGAATLRLATKMTVEGSLRAAAGSVQRITDLGAKFAFEVNLIDVRSEVDLEDVVVHGVDTNGLRLLPTSTVLALDLDGVHFEDGNPTVGVYVNLEPNPIAAGTFSFSRCSFDADCLYNVQTAVGGGVANGAVQVLGATGDRAGELFENDRLAGTVAGNSIQWNTTVADATWTNGAGTGLWSTPGNWNPVGLPTSTARVVIPDKLGTGGVGPDVDVSADVAEILVRSGGEIRWATTATTLRVTGSVTIENVASPGAIQVVGVQPRLIVGGQFENSGFVSALSLDVAGRTTNTRMGRIEFTVGGSVLRGPVENEGRLTFGVVVTSLHGSLDNRGTITAMGGSIVRLGDPSGGSDETVRTGDDPFGDLEVLAGNTYTVLDDLTITGDLDVDGILVHEGALVFGNAATFEPTAGVVRFAGEADRTVPVPPGSVWHDLEIAVDEGAEAVLAGSVAVRDLTIAEDATFRVGNATVTVTGDLTNDGSFDAGGSLVDFRGKPSTIRGRSVTRFHSLGIDQAGAVAGAKLAVRTEAEARDTIEVERDWTNEEVGGFLAGDSTVAFVSGSSATSRGRILGGQTTEFEDLSLAAGVIEIAPGGGSTLDVRGRLSFDGGSFLVGAAPAIRFTGPDGRLGGAAAVVHKIDVVDRLTLEGDDDLTVSDGGFGLMVLGTGTFTLLDRAVVRLGTAGAPGRMVVQGTFVARGSPTITDLGSRYDFDVSGAQSAVDLDGLTFRNPDAGGLSVQATSSLRLDLDDVQFTGGVPGTTTYVDLQYAAIPIDTFDFRGCSFDSNCLFNVHTEVGASAGAIRMAGPAGAKGTEAFEDDGGMGSISGGTIVWSGKTWTNGFGDRNWSTAANWSPAGVPSAADAVTIPFVATGGPFVNVPADVGSLTIGDGGTVSTNGLNKKLAVRGDVSIAANGGLGGGALTVDGTSDVVVGGLLTSAGTVSIGGAGTRREFGRGLAVTAGTFTQSAGFLVVSGPITNAGALSFFAARLSGPLTNTGTYAGVAGTVTLSASATITGFTGGNSFTHLTVPAGVVATATSDLGITGTLDVDGTLVVLAQLALGTGFDSTAGTIRFAGAANQDIPVPPGAGTYHDVVIANAISADATLTGAIVVHDVTIEAGAELSGAIHMMQVTGDFTCDGLFDLDDSHVVFTGMPSTIRGKEVLRLNDLSIGGTLRIDAPEAGSTIEVGGNFENNGTFDASSPRPTTVIFTGPTCQVQGATTTTFHHLTILRGSVLENLAFGDAIGVRGTFTIDGTFTSGNDEVRFGGTDGRISSLVPASFFRLRVDSNARLVLDAGDDLTVTDGATGAFVQSGGTLELAGAAVLRLGNGGTVGRLFVNGVFHAHGAVPRLTDGGNLFSTIFSAGGIARIERLDVVNPDASGLDISATSGTNIQLDGLSFSGGSGAGRYLFIGYGAIPSGAYVLRGCRFAAGPANVKVNVGIALSAVSMIGAAGDGAGEGNDDDPQDLPGSITWQENVWNNFLGTGIWSEPNNWSALRVPGPNDRAVIDVGTVGVGPTLDQNATVASITLKGLTVGTDSSERNLTVEGDLEIDAAGVLDFDSTGTLTVRGSLANAGMVMNSNPALSPLPALDLGSVQNGGSLNLINLRSDGIFVRGRFVSSSVLSMDDETLVVEGDFLQSGAFPQGVSATVRMDGDARQEIQAANAFMNLSIGGADVWSGANVTVQQSFGISAEGRFSLDAGHLLDLITAALTHEVAGTLVLVNPGSTPAGPTTLQIADGSVLHVTGGIRSWGWNNLSFASTNHTLITRSGGAGSYGVHMELTRPDALEMWAVRWSFLRGTEDAPPPAARFPLVIEIDHGGAVKYFQSMKFDNLVANHNPGAINDNGKHNKYVSLQTSGAGTVWDGKAFPEMRFESGGLPDEYCAQKNALGSTVDFVGATGVLATNSTDLDGDPGDPLQPPSDPGVDAIDFSASSAVELEDLRATGYDREVLVEWRTGTELDNVGFHVYRTTDPAAGYVQVSPSLIAGLGDSVNGGEYWFLDRTVANGVTYWYLLEDVDEYGRATMHGPVPATPRLGAGSAVVDRSRYVNGGSTDDDAPRGGGAAPIPADAGATLWERVRAAWAADLERYGVYVLSWTATEIVLEILPPPLATSRVEVGGRAYDSVRVPGYGESETAGAPVLPVLRLSVPVAGVVGGAHEVLEASSTDRSGLVPPPFPDLVFDPAGLRPPTRNWSEDPGWYGSAEFRPEDLFDVGRVAGRGDVDMLPVLFRAALFRGTPSTVRVYDRVVVRIAFEFARPDAADPLSEDLVRQRALAADSGAKKIVVAEDGLYRVPLASLGGVGDPAALALYHLGRPVPIRIEADALWFYGRRNEERTSDNPAAVRWTGENVYWLRPGDPAGALRMAEVHAEPTDPLAVPITTTDASVHVEEDVNLALQYPLWSGQDFRMGRYGYATSGTPRRSVGITAALSRPAASTTPAFHTYCLWGGNGFVHRVRLEVGGVAVGTVAWEGLAAASGTFPVDPALLVDGNNALNVVVLGSPSVSMDLVYVNALDLSFRREARAVAGSVRWRSAQPGLHRASGFAGPARVAVDVTDPDAPRWILGATDDLDDTTFFPAGWGRGEYLLLEPTAAPAPIRIDANSASRWSSPDHGADWIAVAHPSLLEAIRPLAEHREATGLRTALVDVTDLYDEFSFGRVDPLAIRAFVSTAWHGWIEPRPRALLLAGDATMDLGQTGADLVPSIVARTAILVCPADNLFATVDGDDLVPDLAVGRLPVRTPAQAAAVVAKILAYETAMAGEWSERVDLVADNRDVYDFKAWSRELAGVLAGPFVLRESYVDDLPAAEVRARVLAAFDEGRLLVHYAGHGSGTAWASEPLFTDADVAARAAHARLPIVVSMNCLNGQFAFPSWESFGEVLVETPGRGAIAFWGSSAMTEAASQRRLSRAFAEALVGGRTTTLGDAILAGYAAVEDVGNYQDLLHSWVVLGDPALQLPGR